MLRNRISSISVWPLVVAAALPFACATEECDGPGGLCIDVPGGDDDEPGGTSGAAGAPVDGGGGGSRAQGGSSQGGTRAQGGSTAPGGADGAGGEDGGEGGVGARGGASSLGGSGGAGLAGAGFGPAGVGGAGISGGRGPGPGMMGGMGFGGKGMLDPLCHPPSSYIDTCGGGASGGEGGAPGTSSWCDPGPLSPGTGYVLIDDFEDGDGVTLPVFGGRGVWYVANDGGGFQFPRACTGEDASHGITRMPFGLAMHTMGMGIQGYAELGVSFRSSPPACDRPIDASLAKGIKFRAVAAGASQVVRVGVLTVATNPPEDGGDCTSDCYQAYEYSVFLPDGISENVVPFDLLVGGGGAAGVFDSVQASTILNIVFRGQLPCFDFFIDDVFFYD